MWGFSSRGEADPSIKCCDCGSYQAGKSSASEPFPAPLLLVTQAALRSNQTPTGHVWLSVTDLHCADSEGARSLGSLSAAAGARWTYSLPSGTRAWSCWDRHQVGWPHRRNPSLCTGHLSHSKQFWSQVGSSNVVGAPFLTTFFSQLVANWMLQAWRPACIGPPQKQPSQLGACRVLSCWGRQIVQGMAQWIPKRSLTAWNIKDIRKGGGILFVLIQIIFLGGKFTS